MTRVPAELHQVPPGVHTVVFDIGNVLADDVWERMVLTTEHGVADRLGVGRETARAVGTRLWPAFATAQSLEDDWWAAFEGEVGRDVPLAMRREAAALVRPSPDLDSLLSVASGQGLRCGLVSDNTPFWFELQCGVTGMMTSVDPSLVLLSYEHAQLKRDDPGLLARSCDPSGTMVVDDREVNLARAAELGFRPVRYEAWPSD